MPGPGCPWVLQENTPHACRPACPHLKTGSASTKQIFLPGPASSDPKSPDASSAGPSPIHLQPSWQPVCLPRSRSRSRGFPAPPPPAAFQSLQGDLSLTLRPLTCGPLCLRGPSWFAGPTLYRLPTKDTIIAAAVVIPVAGSAAVTHAEGTVEGRPGSRVLALTFILRPHTETPARLRCLGRGVRRMQAPSLLCP